LRALRKSLLNIFVRSVRIQDAHMLRLNIMLRACATTAITYTAEAAWRPSVSIQIGWSMPRDSVKTAISSTTTQRRRSKKSKRQRGRIRRKYE
jgi:hypothetical protein